MSVCYNSGKRTQTKTAAGAVRRGLMGTEGTTKGTHKEETTKQKNQSKPKKIITYREAKTTNQNAGRDPSPGARGTGRNRQAETTNRQLR